MEIIEHGITHHREKCNYCECVFHYNKKDVKTNIYSEDYYKYIKCPECGAIIQVEE